MKHKISDLTFLHKLPHCLCISELSILNNVAEAAE